MGIHQRLIAERRQEMNEFLPSIEIIILIVPLVALVMVIKQMSYEIDELKEKLDKHRARLNYLEFDYLSISEIEKRLYQLEEALELKEYFDKESLNKQMKRDYD